MKSTTKSLLRLLAILLAFSLVAAACGDDDDDDDATTTDPPADEPEPEADPEPEPEDEPEPEADPEPEPEDEPAAKDPIKLAVINQEDGLFAYPELSGVTQVLADHYNSEGGIDGHMLEIELCTAGDDPESAQACAQQFANDDAVEWVYLGAVLNTAPIYEVLGPDGAGKPILGNMLWDVPDSLQPGSYSTDPGLLPLAYEAIRYAVEEDGVTNLAVLVDDSDIGQATLAVVDFFLSGLGGATLTPVPIAVGQADFLPPMTAAGIEDADGLALLIAESAACQTTRDALEALGQGEFPVYVGDWCTGEEFRNAGTAEGWRIVVGQKGSLTDDPEAEELRQIYADAGEDPPFGLAFAGAMNMDWLRQILELAVADAGGVPTGDQVWAAAEARTGPVFLGPDTIECPGVGAWVSTCNSSALMITLEGGDWVQLSDDFNLIDVSIFDPLLAG